MALSKQIDSVLLRGVTTTWNYVVTTQNMTVELNQVNYGSAFDEAVDGSLRSNFRGWRVSLELDYDAFVSGTLSGTGTKFEDLMDSLYTSFVTDGDSYINMRVDDLQVVDINVVPEDISVLTTYRNQISIPSASLRFVGKDILTSIPSNLEST